MTIFNTDCKYAAHAFAGQIEWSKGKGSSQLRHFHTKLTEDFGSRVYVALITSIKDDLMKRFEQLSAAGVIDRSDDPEVTMSVVSLAEGEAISVRFPDGGHLLLVWKTGDDGRFDLYAFPWRDKIPADLAKEIAETVKASPTKASLDSLVKRAKGYSNLTPNDEDLIYSGQPLSLEDLKSQIEILGVEDTSSAAGLGEYSSNGNTYGESVFILTVDGFAHHPAVIGFAEKLVTVFDAKTEVKGYNNRDPHLAALLDGRISDLYNSACALAMEFNIKNGLDTVLEIVENCERLQLSSEASYAYGDEDCIVYAERYEGRDLYVHNNIDLNEGCAYATVLTRSESGFNSCDVYLVERWSSGFEAFYGTDISDGADAKMAENYLLYTIKRDERRWIPEDRLVGALRAGILPIEGRLLSYDMSTGKMKIDVELAHNTGYLDYFRLMTKGDKQALSEALDGAFKGWGETFMFRNASGGPNVKVTKVEPEDYIAGLEPLVKGSCTPKP